MLARLGRDQQIRLRCFFGDGLDVDVVWLTFVVLRLELARTAKNDRGDLLRHVNRRLKFRPQVQYGDFSRIDRDRGDTCTNDRALSLQAEREQQCNRNKPAKSHGNYLRDRLAMGYLRSM